MGTIVFGLQLWNPIVHRYQDPVATPPSHLPSHIGSFVPHSGVPMATTWRCSQALTGPPIPFRVFALGAGNLCIYPACWVRFWNLPGKLVAFLAADHLRCILILPGAEAEFFCVFGDFFWLCWLSSARPFETKVTQILSLFAGSCAGSFLPSGDPSPGGLLGSPPSRLNTRSGSGRLPGSPLR